MATFGLIHGKWHDSSCWGPVAERLRASGHDVVAPDLPLDDPSTTHAERIEPALALLRDVSSVSTPSHGTSGSAIAAEPTVIVGHSLGAGYAPLVAEAVTGSLVYLCPAPVGPFAQVKAPMHPYRPGFPFPPDGPDGNSAWQPGAAIAAMYPRLPREVADALAQRLKPGSSPVDAYPGLADPVVPTTFVYAAEDEFFEPGWSRWAAREVAHVEPIELDTGHFPMFEDPDRVTEILLRVSG